MTISEGRDCVCVYFIIWVSLCRYNVLFEGDIDEDFLQPKQHFQLTPRLAKG